MRRELKVESSRKPTEKKTQFDRRTPRNAARRLGGQLAAVTAFLSLATLVPLSAQITVNQPIPSLATVHVDAARAEGAGIPRTIFGTFLEPIGNSTYNGLWAEVLQNPSLEMGLWDTQH